MSRDVNQLKKEARRAEQRADWDRAIQLYRKAIRASEEAGEVAPDVSLYNRVGDLYRRRGDTDRAVHYYLDAVDRYAEQDLHTGAIALCNKILRITPDRVEVYRKLGRLHAATGLLAEARNSYLEYASRMEDEGRPEARQEAFLELARITEDEKLHLRTVEELEQEGRTELAVEALRELWERRRERGEAGDEIRRRIVALDPTADPGTGGPATPVPDPDASGSGVAPPEEPSGEGAEEGPPEATAVREPEAGGEEPGDRASSPAAPSEDGEDHGAAEVPTRDDALPASAEAGDGPSGRPAGDRTEVRLRYAEVLCRSGRDAEAVEQLEKLLDEIDPVRAPERALRGLELLDEVEALDEAWRERAVEWAEEVDDAEVARRLRDLPGSGDESAAGSEGVEAPARPTGRKPADGPAREERADGPTRTEPEAGRAGDEAPSTGDASGETAGAEEREGVKLDELLVGFRARAEETVGQADPEEHLEMGQALLDMERLDDAIREFQVAARAPEPPIRAFELLGASFLEKGVPSVAVRVLTRALRIPGHQDYDLLHVLYLLGLAREELGDPEAALDCYERVYSIDIDFRDVADRMRAVAR